VLAYQDPSSWQILMRNGMGRDFSWGASACEYGKIYDRARHLRSAEAAAAVATELKREPVHG
jgi:glycogen synthase